MPEGNMYLVLSHTSSRRKRFLKTFSYKSNHNKNIKGDSISIKMCTKLRQKVRLTDKNRQLLCITEKESQYQEEFTGV